MTDEVFVLQDCPLLECKYPVKELVLKEHGSDLYSTDHIRGFEKFLKHFYYTSFTRKIQWNLFVRKVDDLAYLNAKVVFVKKSSNFGIVSPSKDVSPSKNYCLTVAQTSYSTSIISDKNKYEQQRDSHSGFSVGYYFNSSRLLQKQNKELFMSCPLLLYQIPLMKGDFYIPNPRKQPTRKEEITREMVEEVNEKIARAMKTGVRMGCEETQHFPSKADIERIRSTSERPESIVSTDQFAWNGNDWTGNTRRLQTQHVTISAVFFVEYDDEITKEHVQRGKDLLDYFYLHVRKT